MKRLHATVKVETEAHRLCVVSANNVKGPPKVTANLRLD